MERDRIVEIAIDAAGQLHVVPASRAFPTIDREGIDVHWNAQRRSLYSPTPRQWSYPRWFTQIRRAAVAQGCHLQFDARTRWVNIEPDLQAELLQVARTVAILDR